MNSGANDDSYRNDVMAQLINHLGWTYSQTQTHRMQTIQLLFSTNAPTVLIIDDNDALIDLLKRYLSDTSFRVVGTQQGLEGIRLAQEIRPDLVILDVMMPNMDGKQLIERLSESAQLCNVPIILSSATDYIDQSLANCDSEMLIYRPNGLSANDILHYLQATINAIHV